MKIQENKGLLYTRFERFWHWAQALLIIVLLCTGFTIHGSLGIMDFGTAVVIHNQAAWLLMGLTVFAIFWHLTTGAWQHYIPTLERAADVVSYYCRDIFKGCAHPVSKDARVKFNPLQRCVYFLLKALLFPLQIITGLFYMYASQMGKAMELDMIATLHTMGGFAFLGFLIVHVYLGTTGKTVTANYMAMLTGREPGEATEQG